jgi:hypothetical protein
MPPALPMIMEEVLPSSEAWRWSSLRPNWPMNWPLRECGLKMPLIGVVRPDVIGVGVPMSAPSGPPCIQPPVLIRSSCFFLQTMHTHIT